ncbi:MAG: hypothetical protein K2X94_02745, partial [Amoebophilaceae bacterium]|nr:hypothetical protein [Amoebophilaceae bacterium]
MDYKKKDKELKRAEKEASKSMQIPIGKASVKQMIAAGFYAEGIKRMYNPDSILKFFRDKSFGSYWSNSGNPAILLQQIKNNIDRFTIP